LVACLKITIFGADNKCGHQMISPIEHSFLQDFFLFATSQ
jgi:hypothetical protein